MKNREAWVVIGISGVTCAGKTTLALRLLSTISPSVVFHQDRYFFPDDHPRHIPCEGLDEHHNNYDVLTALDMDQMYKDVVDTIEGVDRSHARNDSPDARKVAGKRLLVFEGFTALNYPPLYELCDLRYYFTLEYGECFSRRALRLYDPPDVHNYFEKCVWPEHVKYREQMERLPAVRMISGTDTAVLDLVLSELGARGLTPQGGPEKA